MLTVILNSAIGYLLGVAVHSAVRILQFTKEFPTESKQIKILQTYWTREWSGFALSFAVGFAYVFAMPEIIGREIFHTQISDMVRIFSIAMGIAGQWIGIASFGATRKVLQNLSSSKGVNIDDDGNVKSTPKE